MAVVVPPRRTHRLSSLDGLRGVAAVVVLVHHALLTFPGLASGYYGERSGVPLAWVLSYTPLHVFWAGTEAVYLFFVLSGIVLVLPVLQAPRRFSWLGYYPRRILRLYLPVVAAVIFGAILVLVVKRYRAPGLGAWMNSREPAYTTGGFVRDVVLIFGPSRVISPLWSLRWEVVFSLLLPLFVLLAVALTRWWWMKMIGLFTLIAVGSMVGEPSLFFLPIFGVGALLVARWERIGVAAARLDRNRWAWPSLIVAALLMTTCTWLLAPLGGGQYVRFTAWVPVVGVALFAIIGGHCALAVRMLSTRIVQWLGTISFSLYLVHEPLVIAARLLTYPLSPWIGLAISIPLAFLVAWLFTRYIEQPAHHLSRWVGARAAALSRPNEIPTQGLSD